MKLFFACLLAASCAAAEFPGAAMTPGETTFLAQAKADGMTDAQFERLRVAWTVSRRSGQPEMTKIIGRERGRALGDMMMARTREKKILVSDSQRTPDVEAIWRECCAEILGSVKDAAERSEIIKRWIEIMKV